MLRPSHSLTVAHWRRLNRIRLAVTAAAVVEATAAQFDPQRVARVVLDGQRTMVATVDANMATMAAYTAGGSFAAAGVNPERLIGVAARNGTTLEDVYNRTHAVARASGYEAGIAHLRRAVNVDSQLAQRSAAHAVVASDRRVVGWRRQTNPVAGGKTCGLCIVAATKRYSKQDLLPIHPMCRCTVYPIYSSDPIAGDDIFDRDLLEEAMSATDGDTSRSALGAIRLDADQVPDGIDTKTLEGLNARVGWHPEMGEWLTGDRHDSTFTI